MRKTFKNQNAAPHPSSSKSVWVKERGGSLGRCLSPGCRYGAHWWLNACDPADNQDREWPDLPSDIFWADGHDGQSVVVVPSRDVVLVRLGFSPDPEAWDLGVFIGDVLEAIPADGG